MGQADRRRARRHGDPGPLPAPLRDPTGPHLTQALAALSQNGSCPVAMLAAAKREPGRDRQRTPQGRQPPLLAFAPLVLISASPELTKQFRESSLPPHYIR